MSLSKLTDLYATVLRIRMIEEAIAEKYAEQEMRCPVHLCIGQEAVAAGICANLSDQDYAVSGHRSHGHYLAKGGDLKAMIAELYGKSAGCCGGMGGSMHLIDLAHGFLGAVPIVGSTIPIGVGAAFSAHLSKDGRVSAIFFGDGACEEGVFHESINYAALKNLPAVFICENNLYSVYSNLSVRQPANRDLASIAEGHGVKSFRGNGNNALEVDLLAKEAIEYARSGQGPTFLELSTYRWREHCGPNYDNDIGYRTVEEYEEWKKYCPLAFLENKLTEADADHGAISTSLRATIEQEITEAFDAAAASEFPDPEMIAQHLFSE